MWPPQRQHTPTIDCIQIDLQTIPNQPPAAKDDVQEAYSRQSFRAQHLVALAVSVRVRHPPAHSVAHPWTNNSVLGVQPHGIVSDVRTWHVGTGHRRAAQSAGLVVRVMVGHGVVVVVGGSTTTEVMTRVCCVDVEVLAVVVGGIWRRVLVVGQGMLLVRNSMPQPWYGHAASQGTARVAVGTAAGQPQELRSVVVKLQSVKGHVTPQARF